MITDMQMSAFLANVRRECEEAKARGVRRAYKKLIEKAICLDPGSSESENRCSRIAGTSQLGC